LFETIDQKTAVLLVELAVRVMLGRGLAVLGAGKSSAFTPVNMKKRPSIGL